MRAPVRTSELPVRERILVATLEVIAADGLGAVRHRRVAELAGVSPGSTTYHFASRDDLIEEAFAYYLEQAAAVLDEVAEPADAEHPVDALVGYIGRLLDREFLRPRLVQAEYELILHATRTPRLAHRLAEWERRQALRFEEFLRLTGAPHPQEGARALIAAIRGLELERLIHPGRRGDPVGPIVPFIEALWPAADRSAARRPSPGDG